MFDVYGHFEPEASHYSRILLLEFSDGDCIWSERIHEHVVGVYGGGLFAIVERH
jgi:hypothetical protein